MQEETQDKARNAARELKGTARQLFLAPAAFGSGYRPGGRPKKVSNLRGVKGGQAKSNKRMPGESVLRRDVPAVARLFQIQTIKAACKEHGCEPGDLSPDTWRTLCARFGETKKCLLKLLPRQDDFTRFVQESRLGGHGRGSLGNGLRSHQKNISHGCRIRGGLSETQQPLMPIIKNLKAWFDHERTWGVEVVTERQLSH